MSNFTAAKTGGWSTRQKLTSTQLTQLQEMLLKAPNFSEGSTHSLTGALTIGATGAGALVISAPTTLSGTTTVSGFLDAATGSIRTKSLVYDSMTTGATIFVYAADFLFKTNVDSLVFQAGFHETLQIGMSYRIQNCGSHVMNWAPIPSGSQWTIASGASRLFYKNAAAEYWTSGGT